MLRTLSHPFDFHTHSCCSDGELSPAALVLRAKQKGLSMLALTDHDTVAGIGEAKVSASSEGIQLISGTEITTATDFGEVHILGLGINEKHPGLRQLLQEQQQLRAERARQIDGQLTKAGVSGVLEDILKKPSAVVTRSHFAQSLVRLGYAKDAKQAFKRYLGKSGPVKFKSTWGGLQEVITVIKEAGGIAVLAHPTRYPISNRKLGLLIGEFASAGGRAIELAYPGVNPNQTAWLQRLRQEYKLMASSGSDFHFSGRSWSELGRFFAVDEATPHIRDFFSQAG